jgi:hypothetical protein
MNFLLTPDRRSESVVVAYSLMSNRAVGLQTQEFLGMCDYSLQSMMSRPAKVGDKLTTRNFGTGTRGFAAPEFRAQTPWAQLRSVGDAKPYVLKN